MPSNARSLCASPEPTKPVTPPPSSPMHPSTPLYIPTSSLSLHPHPRETPPRRPVLSVVVTGGSTGIGEAIVTLFAEAGHRVLFTYLTRRGNAERLQSRYPHVTATQLDQAQVSSVASFSRTVDDWAGAAGVHILVNNAALGSATVRQYVHQKCQSPNFGKLATEQLPSSAVDMLMRAQNDLALMRVNALGPLWVTDALSDSIRRAADVSGRATIVFIGSVGGGSAAVFPEYCAADLMSKAALTYFSKHLAAQHVRDNIDVMCISPGATETEMFRQSTLATIPDVPAFVDSMPKRRLIQPHEIAKSVFWLSVESPQGVFHGSVLDASMGLAVRPGLQTENDAR
ncbi:Protein FixR [Gracilariopsis chorda]|uniref:Protein FixR n=1 Tax=Gracilariopsis chorda TaxID=448386 RepID=A0A2V3IE52_9FLOR|nr:Protein FixR [Gracilariopsis chorda]|eukprot:PXF40365.1 Protein FixR [Gracilariopsis chorda]